MCTYKTEWEAALKIVRTPGHGVEIIWDDLVRDTPREMGVSPSWGVLCT